MDENKLTLQEWHRKQAVQSFNNCWDLIEKKDRTKADDLLMIHMAHASRFHWGEIGTSLNFARGEWQVSRVYALVGMFESARYHAQNSLDYCLENNIADFDLAFAYEALARAYKLGNDPDMKHKYIALAEAAALNITKVEDKKYFLSELSQI